MAMTGRQIQRLVMGSAFRPSYAPALAQIANKRFSSTGTTTISDAEELARLNAQRKLRPSSPHFTIYQPQLTWISSIANRVTGCGLSVGIYGFALSYLALPAIGVPMDSDTLVSVAASAPEWLKMSAKGIVALPFTYHGFNGLRHLSWDMGWFITLRSSYIAGYAVLGASAVSAVGLVML